MTRRSAALIAIASMLPVVIASARQQPPRDAFRTGTATITGVISARDTGRPMPRATVAISGIGVPGLTAFTDDAGRFTFTALPGGQFTLSASKPQFLTLAYGQEQPGRGSGVPVALKDGESRTVSWALPRAATISGRVLDLDGRAYRAGVVVVQQRRAVDGGTRFVTCCAQARTDGSGVYQLTGLLPGEYFVSVVPSGDYLVIGDAPAVYSDEMRRVSDEEVQWALAAARSGSASLPAPPAPARGRSIALGRVYFGGVLDPERSPPVVLEAGEERGGVDMSLQLVPTASLSARAQMADATPPANASFVFSNGWSSSGSALPADGRFERRNLAPGQYRLTVRGRGASVSGTALIDVTGDDIHDLIVNMQPAARVSGNIVFEPGAIPAPDAAQVQVTLSPVSLMTPVRAGADGRWEMPLVDPGRYRLNAVVPAAARNQWSLKSIMASGRDITDTGFEIASGEAISDVIVTFTSRRTSLSGTLLTAENEPAAGFYVVVFPDDERQWSAASRRIPAPARTATDGAYQFSGLPPGTYRLAALTQVDPASLTDTAFLAALKAKAIPVTLGEGESKKQDVRFGK